MTTDSVDWLGAFFRAFGAELVNEKGENYRQVGRNATGARLPAPAVGVSAARRQCLGQRLKQQMARFRQGQLDLQSPSAWAVAKRDAPQVAEKLWTHAMPRGPKGRFVSVLPRFQGIWNFSKNKSAAKALLQHVSTREAAAKLVEGGQGYDLPPFVKFHDFKTWGEQLPPKGTLSHYPNKGDQVSIVPLRRHRQGSRNRSTRKRWPRRWWCA